MSNQQTLQQKRAAHAWQCIEWIVSGAYRGKAKEYGSLVRGLPAMIQHDGLAPTLAFLLAKAKTDAAVKSHHRAAYDHLADWIKGEFQLDSKRDLLEWLLNEDAATYRRTANEALAYLNWLKRFAEAKGLSSDENA